MSLQIQAYWRAMTSTDLAWFDRARSAPILTEQHPSMDYRREVDGLRALAVLPVMLFHAGFELAPGGFAGVDVFFVISGYLITSLILADLQAGTFRLGHFYERRARRILPALFAVMFLCLPFAWQWLPPHDLEEFAQSLIAVASFSSNVLFWRSSGYFDTAAELKPLLHTWSLAVEEQFYLLFPACLMLLWRWGRGTVMVVLVLLAVLSLTAAHLGAQASSLLRGGTVPPAVIEALPSASFYLLPTRAWELLIGSLVAFRLSRPGTLPGAGRLSQVLGLTGLAAITYALLAFDAHTAFPGLPALVPTLGTALVLLHAGPTTVAGRLLGQPLMVGIGLISYSAYLWHQPLMALARHRSPDEPGQALLAGLILLSLGLAWLTWRWIERPFRDRSLIPRKRLVVYASAASLWFAALGAFGVLGQGFAGRFDFKAAHEGEVGHLGFHRQIAEQFHACTPGEVAQAALYVEQYPRCAQSRRDGPVQVALVGDSHAEHLFPGLAEQMGHRNLAFYIRDSPAVLGNPDFDLIFHHVLVSPSIDTVLLTMRWAARQREIARPQTLESALARTVQALVEANKTVYLIADVPKFPFKAERCKFVPLETGQPLCEIEAARIHEIEKRYLPALQKVAARHPSLRLVELRDLFCEQETCSMSRNGTLLYRDNNHLNIAGSRYVGQALFKRFPELAR